MRRIRESFNFVGRLALISVGLFFFCLVPQQAAAQCAPPEQRIDCHPDPNPTEARCVNRGCDWCPADGGASCGMRPGYGYSMDSLQVEDNGYRVLLSRASADFSYFGGDFELLTATFTYESDYRLRIRIAPEEKDDRFEVPVQIHPPATGPSANVQYAIDFSDSPTFGFQIKRRSTDRVIFDTTLSSLTFADQFIQLAIKLPSENVYGLGENEQPTFRQNFSSGQTYALWTRDQPPDGTANMYGAHPYYTVVEPDGNAHSVVILNSNAQEFALHPAPAYIYRTIGGILDIYIFLGPTPEETVSQYTEAIGRMPIPHYWALGFHLCRFGYNNIANMRAAVDRTAAAGIPQDVQYSDLDNLDHYKSFTYDPINYAGLPEYVQELKARGIKHIISVEAYISTLEPNYKPLQLGNQLDVWVKRQDDTNYLGKTIFFDDPVYWPDFSKSATSSWWAELVREFHDVIEFDGLWLDMNEPAQSPGGDLERGCDANSAYNVPPYLPAIRGGELWSGTICPDAKHEGGLHYDLHSLYALKEAEATTRALKNTLGKRGFILCRSNWLGLGQHAAHWLGDNYSNWPNLRASIIGVLQYNQFGVPMVGPDICGFFDDSTEELCTRWLQMGAFFPFSRSHNMRGPRDQDPASWGPESIASTRRALLVRYTLLPYLYTLFYYHVRDGGTVARALWHTFPSDPVALGIDQQFMWGTGLLISPVLYEGATSADAYFPASRWYSYYDGAEVQGVGTGAYKTLDAPFDFINLHIRGGSILPTQEPAMNTELSKHNPYGLIIALDEQGKATGGLYLDDGDSIDPEVSGAYFELEFSVEGQNLQTRFGRQGFDVTGKLFDTIRILGQGQEPPISLVIVNGLFHSDFAVDPATGELLVSNMNAPVGGTPLTVSWI